MSFLDLVSYLRRSCTYRFSVRSLDSFEDPSCMASSCFEYRFSAVGAIIHHATTCHRNVARIPTRQSLKSRIIIKAASIIMHFALYHIAFRDPFPTISHRASVWNRVFWRIQQIYFTITRLNPN